VEIKGTTMEIACFNSIVYVNYNDEI